MTTTVYIETTGCQMNKLDSQLVADKLQAQGFSLVDQLRDAQVALINTCSVRQHAEEKVFGRLGHFYYHKRSFGRPRVIGIIGCMAQRTAQTIRRRCPYLDIICGPGQLHKIAELIRQALENGPIVAVDDFSQQRKALASQQSAPQADDPLEQLDLARRARSHRPQAFVRIQRGCDNFCSYCVVPHVRGPQRSRPPQNILEEIRTLAQAGCIEVTLLGQTVNSYKYTSNGKIWNLAELLHHVNEIAGLRRIRFLTNYPAQFDLEIFAAMAQLPKLCPYLHIPAQSGSDRILQAMNRHYTSQQYLELIHTARQIVPGISIVGDFIVGFPGETDQDFQDSLALLEQVRYKNCFIFKYSPRPDTVAAKHSSDPVPPNLKQHRLEALLNAQNAISLESKRTLLGSQQQILVEGPSKRQKHLTDQPPQDLQLMGRTATDQIVVFNGPAELAGQIVEVDIHDASALTLFGKLRTSNRITSKMM